MSKIILNTVELTKALTDIISHELAEIRKDLTEMAMRRYEQEVRKVLAKHVVGVIENSYSVERLGDIVQIRVNLGKKDIH